MQTQQRLGQAWSQALREGRLDALLDLYHPHALLETPVGRFHGRANIEAALGTTAWRELQEHRTVATRVLEDRIAMITRHGGWTLEHVMQLVAGQIRAHRVEHAAPA